MLAELRNVQPQIAHLARLSDLAYLQAGETADCQQLREIRRGAPISCHVADRPVGLLREQPVFLIETDEAAGRQTIAIRGTDGWGTAAVDADTRWASDERLKVRMHAGFRDFARAVHEHLRSRRLLKRGAKVVLTGHSLGGAAALALGLYLYADTEAGITVESVVTFGQPKVFDNAGATAWPFFSRRVLRVVTCDDIVPILPLSPSILGNFRQTRLFNGADLDRYQHFGVLLLVKDSGRFWMSPGIDIERGLGGGVLDWAKNVWGRQLDQIDHRMQQYRDRLRFLDAAPVPDNTLDPSVCSRVAPQAGPAVARL
jgi:pimeloyl-ACP methyl ester carboxylesterase